MNEQWVIHRYFAEQCDGRLDFVHKQPKSITLIGVDGDISRKLLAKRYPKAVFHEYDERNDVLQTVAKMRQPHLFSKWLGKGVAQTCQTALSPLPEASCEMLWSNLALLRSAEPMPVFRNWATALITQGLLFFTCLGRDSLQELIARLQADGIVIHWEQFYDMHDLGDMLADSGFYDPVMDTAKLCLQYQNAETFWQDMNLLGLWQTVRCADKAQAEAKINQYLAEGLSITLEAVFGHAVKKLVLPEGEQEVQFFPRINKG